MKIKLIHRIRFPKFLTFLAVKAFCSHLFFLTVNYKCYFCLTMKCNTLLSSLPVIPPLLTLCQGIQYFLKKRCCIIFLKRTVTGTTIKCKQLPLTIIQSRSTQDQQVHFDYLVQCIYICILLSSVNGLQKHSKIVFYWSSQAKYSPTYMKYIQISAKTCIDGVIQVYLICQTKRGFLFVCLSPIVTVVS